RLEGRIRGHPYLKPRADGSRPRAGQLEKGRRAESLRVAREESEAFARIHVDPGPWVEPAEVMDASARSTEPVVDLVAEIVPASGDGQDEARARAGEAARPHQGVLRVEPRGRLVIGGVRLQGLGAPDLLASPAGHPWPRVLRPEDHDVVLADHGVPMARLQPAARRNH